MFLYQINLASANSTLFDIFISVKIMFVVQDSDNLSVNQPLKDSTSQEVRGADLEDGNLF